MEKLISYPVSIIYGILFFLLLLIFHPVQIICLRLFGYDAHRLSVAVLNWCLMRCTNILGTRYTIDNQHNLPDKTPLIFVANMIYLP